MSNRSKIKITLTSSSSKDSFISSFRRYLKRYFKRNDYSFNWGDYDVLGGNKAKNRLSPHTHYLNDDYNFDDISLDTSDSDLDAIIMASEKEIYFYQDYKNPNDFLFFHTLSEFIEYCESNNYHISKSEMENLKYRYLSHCCLDNNSESNRWGTNEIVSETSYPELCYDVYDLNDLGYE